MRKHLILTASVLLAGFAAQPASAQFHMGMGPQTGNPGMMGPQMGMDAAIGRRPMPNGISVGDGMGGWTPYIPTRPSNVMGHSAYEGRTTTVTRNPDGSRDVAIEENGQSRTETRREMPGISVGDGNGGWKPYVPEPRGGDMASGTYEGRTTTVRRNDDGSRTMSMVDALGRMTERLAREPARGTISIGDGNGGWIPYTPPPKTNELGSSTYEGKTTVVTRNPDGSHTVTATENGKTTTEVNANPPKGTISVGDGKGGWIPYTPPPKTNELGSSTYEGKKTVVTRNPDGSHTVTATENGKTRTEVSAKPPKGTISVGDGKGGWKPYTPPAKSNVLGSSTYDGKTTTVTRNADGSHTVTVTPAR